MGEDENRIGFIPLDRWDLNNPSKSDLWNWPGAAGGFGGEKSFRRSHDGADAKSQQMLGSLRTRPKIVSADLIETERRPPWVGRNRSYDKNALKMYV